jgi:hypothetical protein
MSCLRILLAIVQHRWSEKYSANCKKVSGELPILALKAGKSNGRALWSAESYMSPSRFFYSKSFGLGAISWKSRVIGFGLAATVVSRMCPVYPEPNPEA